MDKKRQGASKLRIKKDDTSEMSIITEEGKKHEVPVEGSLGLLALGAKGLLAWREKREKVEKSKKKSSI
ncbi:MAG: hypothetical protein FVQ77_12655 [Cytophagales bacterium]|nr:hypothetical protein [Cytophagales bacterium]